MKVSDILRVKGGTLYTTHPLETLQRVPAKPCFGGPSVRTVLQTTFPSFALTATILPFHAGATGAATSVSLAGTPVSGGLLDMSTGPAA